MLVIVPSQPSRNASGIETLPGLSSGNQWKSTPLGNIDRFLPVGSSFPETTGLNAMSVIALIRPP